MWGENMQKLTLLSYFFLFIIFQPKKTLRYFIGQLKHSGFCPTASNCVELQMRFFSFMFFATFPHWLVSRKLELLTKNFRVFYHQVEVTILLRFCIEKSIYDWINDILHNTVNVIHYIKIYIFLSLLLLVKFFYNSPPEAKSRTLKNCILWDTTDRIFFQIIAPVWTQMCLFPDI